MFVKKNFEDIFGTILLECVTLTRINTTGIWVHQHDLLLTEQMSNIISSSDKIWAVFVSIGHDTKKKQPCD